MTRTNFRHRAIALAVASIALACGAGGACAATPAPAAAARTHAASLSHADRGFIDKAAEAGMGEVEVGKLAQQKASSEDVKQFASRMVADHTKANDELERIAKEKGYSAPSKLDKSAQKEIDQMSKLSGTDFDKAYIDKQVSDHKKVIAAFEKEAKSGGDADVKRFASDTLPTLQDHLKMAQSTQGKVHEELARENKSNPGMKAARKATGSTTVAAEKADRMPVEKSGM